MLIYMIFSEIGEQYRCRTERMVIIRTHGRYAAERAKHRGVIFGLLAAIFFAAVLTAFFLLHNKSGDELRGNAFPTASAAASSEEASPKNTDSFTPSASGVSSAVDCKGSYTAAFTQSAADTVVATAGDAELTNESLQILYLNQVNSWRKSDNEQMPDFSEPLEGQACPLASNLSWQQYFLERAILGWQAQQALLYGASQPIIIEEEAFQPDSTDTLHEKYVSPDLPVNNFLYQDLECYTPNKLHSAYLEQLDEQLEELAKSSGYADLADMASKCAGASAQSWVQLATDYNTAYMYFTEESYDLSVDSGDASGETADSFDTVDIRHILIIPEGADVASDGTVTATQEQWEAARKEAEEVLQKCEKPLHRSTEAEFSQIASEISDDAGSKLNGGAYYGIQEGQLIQELDEWCFSTDRKATDTAVIRSVLGYHVVMVTALHQSEESAAEDTQLRSLQYEQWEQWLEYVPLNADYSAAALWADTTAVVPTLEDTLYPDIGHERFPEPIVYLQQDFYSYPFGDRAIGPNGCGITTYAMLATYMTDSLQTPPMMADRFTNFFDYVGHATDGNIFIYAPAEMGFYYEEMTFELDGVIEALQSGKVVISLQRKGNFTSSGHYLLLIAYNEEDGTFTVRDSNIFNYGRLSGHKIDRFTAADLLSGGGHFYIFQPKITTIPACSRCGTDYEERQPELLLQKEYTCEKCAAALSRRNHFLSILSEMEASEYPNAKMSTSG